MFVSLNSKHEKQYYKQHNHPGQGHCSNIINSHKQLPVTLRLIEINFVRSSTVFYARVFLIRYFIVCLQINITRFRILQTSDM